MTGLAMLQERRRSYKGRLGWRSSNGVHWWGCREEAGEREMGDLGNVAGDRRTDRGRCVTGGQIGEDRI